MAKVSQKEIRIPELKFINDSLDIKEKMVVQKKSDVRVQLQVGISEELMVKLRRVQDVFCQKRQKSLGLESVLEEMVTFYLKKQDPLEVAKERERKGVVSTESANETGSGRSEELNISKFSRKKKSDALNKDISFKASRSRRQKISSAKKHQLHFKWKGRCSYTDGRGERCSETRFLDIHHIHPVSGGGTDDLNNLTLLCKGHHRMIHLKNS